jgi:hypothetical protein
LTGGTLTGGLIGTTGSFSSSGSGDTFTIGHTSGSGIALNITKSGNGEGLYINKASGSGNAATIIGTLNATTLVKSGGTASQFLKADGSVDSSTYLTTSAASSTYLPLTGGTLTGALSGTSATFSGSVTSGGIISSEDVRIYRSAGTTTGYINFGSTGTNYFGWGGSGFVFNGSINAGAATFSSTLQTNGNAYILPSISGGGSGGLYLGVFPDTQYTKQAILVERYVGGLGNYGRGSLHFCNRDTVDTNQPTLADSRMVITSGGNVLIGTTTDNGYKLDVLGQTLLKTVNSTTVAMQRQSTDGVILAFYKDASVVGTISTNSNSLPSDLNFKKNINNLELGLNLVTKLRSVSYNHKIDDDNSALSTGFIAQELEQSLTELGVKENEYHILQHKPNEDKTQSQYWLDYTKMIPILIKAIQEQQAQIEELKAMIAAK